MSTLDTFLVWLNIAGASFASGVNFYAARVAFRTMRPIYWTISFVSAIYVLAYLSLLFSPVDPDDWVSFMRGLSFPVWIVVWAGPAHFSLKVAKSLAAAMQDLDRRSS